MVGQLSVTAPVQQQGATARKQHQQQQQQQQVGSDWPLSRSSRHTSIVEQMHD
jgi:hypothetical protein